MDRIHTYQARVMKVFAIPEEIYNSKSLKEDESSLFSCDTTYPGYHEIL